MPTDRRFIPAWAGNSRLSVLCDLACAVHPRVGGEQATCPKVFIGISGSSPRGRGTGPLRHGCPRQRRFIPAWAGNRMPHWQAWRPTAVHPRVGGEQGAARRVMASDGGSSPRGRGTGRRPARGQQPGRFIPAWAGNRVMVAPKSWPAPVHPRVGGEQGARPRRYSPVAGSSPRGRGTVAALPAW